MGAKRARQAEQHVAKKSKWDEDCAVRADQYDKASFFSQFIGRRRPCKLVGQVDGLDLSRFAVDRICDTLGCDEQLLVEYKQQGGFGSGSRRTKMVFRELMEKLQGDAGDQYYLTTQYLEDDPDGYSKDTDNDEDEDENENDEQDEEQDGEQEEVFESFSDAGSIDFNNLHDDFEEDDLDDPEDDNDQAELSLSEARDRVAQLVQKPLTNLLLTDQLPLNPLPITSSLLPQQINLWVGATRPNSDTQIDESSFKVQKDLPDLGLGRKMFGEGISSGLHHDHADNLYLLVSGVKRFTVFPPTDAPNLYTVGEISKIFDSGVIDYKVNERAPNWLSVRADGAIVGEDRSTPADPAIDPPSFSKIPPSILHLDLIEDDTLRQQLTSAAKEKWPLFFKCRPQTFWLKPGEMLYLPAGWFHEVTSFSENEPVHIAINYWFSPPDGKTAEKPYTDSYWPRDFERTLRACEMYKQFSK